jgi:integrase/recombinase XerD
MDSGGTMPTLIATPFAPALRRESGRTHNVDYGVIRALPQASEVDTSAAEVLAAEFLTSYTGHTADAYRRDLTDYFNHAASIHLDPLDARRVHLARYLQQLAQSGLSPATVARRLVTLRGYYNYAVDESALTTSSAARIKTRRQHSQTAIRALDTNDLRALLWAADAHSPRMSALTWLLATTGLRISEACNARIDDLHQLGEQTWLNVTCKGNVRRSVPLVAPARDRVTTLILGRDTGPLFATRTGTALDRHGAARTLRSLAADLDLGPFSPHVLRHTFVTLARANGCALEDVQDAVGHADPATTRRYDRTIQTMANHPAGPLLTALAAIPALTGSPARVSSPPTHTRTAMTAKAGHPLATGRPILRLNRPSPFGAQHVPICPRFARVVHI